MKCPCGAVIEQPATGRPRQSCGPRCRQRRKRGRLELVAPLVQVAALYVQRNGAYFGVDGVDPYDEARDARTYQGPFPVVVHPPCARWCRLAGLVEKRWGKKRGDDGGLFAHALEQVRTWGGVLEHPAYSDAWRAFGLPRPKRGGGWVRGKCGGFACHVEQGRYGHVAKKATWLYVFNTALPALRWGSCPDVKSQALVSWCGNRTDDTRPRLGKRQASASPAAFRDTLVELARTVDRSGRVRLRGPVAARASDNWEGMTQRTRSATPPQFRDTLIGVARTAFRSDR